MLSPDGVPTSRYYEFLDQSQSGRVLAQAVEEAYRDLFQLRRDAQNMGRPEVKGKIKTLTQGKVSDAVVDKMAMTFLALAGLAVSTRLVPPATTRSPRRRRVQLPPTDVRRTRLRRTLASIATSSATRLPSSSVGSSTTSSCTFPTPATPPSTRRCSGR
jgi:hypothetical protein